MTPTQLVAMRKVAALAFAVPDLEVDITWGTDLVARVERRHHTGMGGGSTDGGATTLLGPCVFRAAVGGATAHVRRGGRAVFLGLGAERNLHLQCCMPFTGAATPLGMIVSRLGGRMVHVFATTVVPARARAMVHAVVAGVVDGVVDGDLPVTVSWDPVTEVSLVSCETPTAVLATARPQVEAAMTRLLLDTGVEEIVDSVGAYATRSAG